MRKQRCPLAVCPFPLRPNAAAALSQSVDRLGGGRIRGDAPTARARVAVWNASQLAFGRAEPRRGALRLMQHESRGRGDATAELLRGGLGERRTHTALVRPALLERRRDIEWAQRAGRLALLGRSGKDQLEAGGVARDVARAVDVVLDLVHAQLECAFELLLDRLEAHTLRNDCGEAPWDRRVLEVDDVDGSLAGRCRARLLGRRLGCLALRRALLGPALLRSRILAAAAIPVALVVVQVDGLRGGAEDALWARVLGGPTPLARPLSVARLRLAAACPTRVSLALA
mmetsp:Transcript_49881/g.153447  ORF Transcript_49881/g.153447 Transcript_49881/m.153447 type:complete len:286 (-) Transcript_49881:27-884(-)